MSSLLVRNWTSSMIRPLFRSVQPPYHLSMFEFISRKPALVVGPSRQLACSPLGLLCSLLIVTIGCGKGGSSSPSSDSEVVVYAALDREFSEPILDDFQQQEDIKVRAKYDVESSKTVGLFNEIVAQANRPRCDVFWNNEILQTLRLHKKGLLDVHHSPLAKDYPAEFRSTTGHWYGFAARARVLIVNTRLVPEDQRPRNLRDLLDPRWKGRCGIARPLFGTTATHATVLFHRLGKAKAEKFFTDLRGNARVLSGNKQVAQDVANGRLAFGITDTDDAIIEIENGHPVVMVYPDQGDGEMGTLLVPNTLGIIKGSPNPQAARRLVDYLLQATIEDQLAKGESAQFPLGVNATVRSRVEPKSAVRWMDVDFNDVVDSWDDAARFLRDKY